MSSTFFAVAADESVISTPTTMTLSNTNAARVMVALGMDVDPEDHPAGEMSVPVIQAAMANVSDDVMPDVANYLHHLGALVSDAVAAGAVEICWA